MRKLLIIAAMAAVTTPVWAQDPPAGMEGVLSSGGSVDMTHNVGAGHEHNMQAMGAAPVTEPGQGAFAAIAEIVAVLDADPATDWSKVDIDALRAHLRDMDLVTVWARAIAEDIPGGQRFTVTGDGDVADAVARMVLAHADVMQGVNSWSYAARATNGSAVLEVTVPESDLAKLKALGFFGVLALGMHHQAHHWMMATGTDPHG